MGDITGFQQARRVMEKQRLELEPNKNIKPKPAPEPDQIKPEVFEKEKPAENHPEEPETKEKNTGRKKK